MSSDKKQEFDRRYENLKKDFCTFKDLYENGDIRGAHRTRRAIPENIAKIMLGDILGETDALKICTGEKKINNKGFIDGTGKAEGKFLLNQVNSALQYKGKNIDVISNIIQFFIPIYDAESGPVHGGDTPYLACNNEKEVLTNFVIYINEAFPTWINDGVCSSKTKECLLEIIQSINELSPKDISSYDKERTNTIINEKHTVRNILDDILSGGTKAVLVLPEHISDYTDLDITSLLNLLKCPWTFIIDYNKGDGDGIFQNIPENERNAKIKQIIDPELEGTEVLDAIAREYNWFFADGSIMNYKTIVHDASGKTRKNRRTSDAITKMYKDGNTTKFVFFVINNAEKIKGWFENLKHDRDFEESFIKNFEFVFFKSTEHKNNTDLNDDVFLKENSDVATEFNLSVDEFINEICDEFKNDIYKTDDNFKLFLNGKEIHIKPSDKKTYNDAGIEFVDTSIDRKEGELDFEHGAEINWKDIKLGRAVEREAFDGHLGLIADKIQKSSGADNVIRLLGMPGTGLTTHARMLAYRIDKKNREHSLNCVVVWINRYERKRIADGLIKLSESINNTKILVVFETHILSINSFNDLQEKLRNEHKNIIFLQVSNIQSKSNKNCTLPDSLNGEEIEKFIVNFHLDKEKKNKIEGLGAVQPIDFPLVKYDEIVSGDLKSYIEKLYEKIGEQWQKICSYIAFVYYYTQKEVFLPLFLGEDDKNWENEENAKFIKQIISEKQSNEKVRTNLWRPRYGVFASFLLKVKFDCEHDKWDTSANLNEIANDFIDDCAKRGNILGNNDEDLLITLFTERNDSDFRNDTDDDGDCGFKQKFSKLIERIGDYGYIDKLMTKLIETYPSNPYFLAHYARFLYEHAAEATNNDKYNENHHLFAKAEDLLKKAINYNNNNDRIYHMQGMLYHRRIQTLLNRLKKQKTEPNEDEKKQSLDNLKEWTDQAKKAFEESEKKARLSSYGYFSEAKTYQRCFEVAKILLGSTDFSDFVNKDDWMDYVERLNKTILQLHEICNNEDSSLFDRLNKLKVFHSNLVGHDQSQINDYYEKSKSLNETKQNREYYSQMYYWATLYTNGFKDVKTNRKLVLKYLPDDSRKRLKEVLERAIKDGSVIAFRQLHDLKIVSTEEYSIDDAITFWRKCKQKCENTSKDDTFEYMNALYMLASYYSARFILAGLNGDAPEPDDEVQANEYFANITKEAHKNRRKDTIRSYYFLGKEDDARVLIDANNENLGERRKVKCLITEIKDGKGYASILPCGMKASFGARTFSMSDVGTTIERQIGFRYENLGLYDSRKENYEPEYYDPEEKMESTDEIQKDITSNNTPMPKLNDNTSLTSLNKDNTNISHNENPQAITERPGIRIIGHANAAQLHEIERDKYKTKRYDTTNDIRTGEYCESKYGRPYIKDDSDGLKYTVLKEELKDEIYDGDKVRFSISIVPHRSDPTKNFKKACDIRLADNDG